MNKYYQITGIMDGVKENLYGSFIREQSEYELEVEKDQYKIEGYKNIKIEIVLTNNEPDPEVYPELFKGGK